VILVVTNTKDQTVDYVEDQFQQMNIQYHRLNTDLMYTKYSHEFHIDNDPKSDILAAYFEGECIDFSTITGVWYRRAVEPNLPSNLLSPQAQKYVAEEGRYFTKCLWRLLEGACWVSKPQAISWASVKLHQMRVARDLGMKIPKSLATTNPEAALRFYETCNGKIIVKPFTANTLEYDDAYVSIYTSRVTAEHLKHIDQIANGITFFQEEIPKQFEVRVTVIGDDIYSAKVDSQNDDEKVLDWRRTSKIQTLWEPYTIPKALANKCMQMVKMYELSYGAFDFAFTPDNEYVFFELNANGQWAWLEIELGYPMSSSLAKTLGG